MISSKITEFLDIGHSILSAPKAGVAGAKMVGTVRKAGACGLPGGGYSEQECLEHEFSLVDCSLIGVGFITWRLAQQSELLECVFKHAPRTIFLSFGGIQELASEIKRCNCLLSAQVQSLNGAKAAVSADADIVVAQGIEASGRGLTTALMLGADEALMSTRFYCSRESFVPATSVSCAVVATKDDTSRSSVIDVLCGYDWPSPCRRTMENQMTGTYGGDIKQLQNDKSRETPHFQNAITTAGHEFASITAGRALDLVDDIPSAADIIRETVDQASAVPRHATNFEIVV
ncbi:MAG: nitronate monooxygenase [Gammaproteobacteria bacterium]